MSSYCNNKPAIIKHIIQFTGDKTGHIEVD